MFLSHLFCTLLLQIINIGWWNILKVKIVFIVAILDCPGNQAWYIIFINKNFYCRSGDVELNPGPRMLSTSNTRKEILLFNESNFVFQYRLLSHNLRSVDVGGGGDCLFKSVSHQLYGDSNWGI